MLNFLSFDGGLFNFARKYMNMKAALIRANRESDVDLFMELSERMGLNARLVDTEEFDDMMLVLQMEQNEMKAWEDEHFEDIVSRRLLEEQLVDDEDAARRAAAKVKEFARERELSLNIISVDELLDEYEDMVFGHMMDERAETSEGYASREEVMEALNK